MKSYPGGRSRALRRRLHVCLFRSMGEATEFYLCLRIATWSTGKVGVAFPKQPVADAERQRDRRQPGQLEGAHFGEVENDELARDSKQRDEKHDLRLYDALLTLDGVLQGVIELKSDQKGENLPEHRLERARLERIQDTENESGQHAGSQPIQRDQNNQADDDRKHEGYGTFETLIVGENHPVLLQSSPAAAAHIVSSIAGRRGQMYQRRAQLRGCVNCRQQTQTLGE